MDTKFACKNPHFDFHVGQFKRDIVYQKSRNAKALHTPPSALHQLYVVNHLCQLLSQQNKYTFKDIIRHFVWTRNTQ